MGKFRKLCLVVLVTLSAVLVVALAGCGPAAPPTTSSPPASKTGTKLVFITQPGNSSAGSSMNPAPAVAVQDSNGNTVTGSLALVRLTITSGTGTAEAALFGPTAVTTVNGVARFNGLSVNKAGSGYTLTATAGNLAPATSAPFAISPGAPARLDFTVEPSQSVAGSPMKPPEVTVQDGWGNAVTGYDGSVSVGLSYGTAPSAGLISGATTVQVVNSVARFTNLVIKVSYPQYKLTATSTSLASATSRMFEIVNAAPVKLAFTVQPEGAIAGQGFETGPKVAVEDAFGNVDISSRVTLTLAITPGTGTAGAVLSGTTARLTEDAAGGLADFYDLSIDKAGTGYTFTATCSGLTSATSQPFDVAAK